MKARNLQHIMRTLAREIDGLELPAVEKISESQEEDPFQVLIATMLSAQTKDAVTAAASARLFRAARTPRSMAKLTHAQIRKMWFMYDPPNAPIKKLSASVYCRAMSHIRIFDPS